jgi:hypothetical protein
MLTQLQAVALRICASANRPLTKEEIYLEIRMGLRNNPQGVTSYLRTIGAAVPGRRLDESIWKLTGFLPAQSTLYKAGERLGIPYSLNRIYSQEQVVAFSQNLCPARARA